jgi:hypothetical protein
MYVDVVSPIGTTGAYPAFSLNDNTSGNRMFLDIQDSVVNDPIRTRVFAGGTSQATYNVGAYNNGMQAAFAYAQDNFATTGNGELATATSGLVPTVNRIFLGAYLNTPTLNGTIRRLVYWRQRLPNSTLQQITQ